MPPPQAAKRGAVPLYHQIFLQLRDEIVGGRRAFGTAVPTEHELAAQFGVSRITARRALAELAEHRLVARKRRVGSTVIFQTPARPIEGNIDQAVDTLLDWGHATKVRVVELGTVASSPEIADHLGLEAGVPVLRAMRVRSLGDTPLGCVVSFVPEPVGRNLTLSRLRAKPILELLREDGHHFASATQTIAARLAEPHLAALLAIEPRAPLLQITRIVRDDAGKPVLMTVASYRSDRYEIRLDLGV